MLNSANFSTFDPSRSKWSRYCEQLKFYLIANKIKEDLKLATVLSLLGDSTFNLLCDLIAPDSPASKTVEQVFAVLEQHFSPKLIARSERFKFRSRKQGQHESIADFVAALRKLSLDCAFKENLDFYLADQFVFGIADPAVQKRLLVEEDNSSFAKLIQIASIAEVSSKDSSSMNFISPSFAQVCQVSRSEARSSCPVEPDRRICCKHCGKPDHYSVACKYLDAICHYCGKRGHITPVCNSRKAFNTRVSGSDHQIDKKSRSRRSFVTREDTLENDVRHISEQDIADNEVLHDVVDYSVNHFAVVNDHLEVPAVCVNIQVNKVNLTFELDTGAAVSVIPFSVFRKHFSEHILKKTNVVLRTLSGKLFPLGKFFVNVKLGSKQASQLELYVIPKSTASLIGRAWFNALGLGSDFNSHPASYIHSEVNDEDLSLKFEDFSLKLDKILFKHRCDKNLDNSEVIRQEVSKLLLSCSLACSECRKFSDCRMAKYLHSHEEGTSQPTVRLAESDLINAVAVTAELDFTNAVAVTASNSVFPIMDAVEYLASRKHKPDSLKHKPEGNKHPPVRLKGRIM